MEEGKPKFPLRWTHAPLAVMGFDFDKMTPYKQGVVCFSEKFPLIKINELLNRERDDKIMEAYLRECL